MKIFKHISQIPHSIWVLGVVSLFTDISSEIIHSVLPIFLVSVLGASTTMLGLIEGTAEAIIYVSKIFSGPLSDYYGKRKPLTVLGYGLSACSKMIFPLASSVTAIFIARCSDRFGKGVREAPRDALIADTAPAHLYGASYGLRQSLDTIGAVLGPVLAIAFMLLTQNHYRLIFWLATIPAFFSVLLLVIGVREPKRVHVAARHRDFPLRRVQLRRLGKSFWGLVIVASIFALGKFSEAFLLLKASTVGISSAYIPVTFIVMNSVYALVAFPVGYLSDRIGRKGLLLIGFFLLGITDVILAQSQGIWLVLVGSVFWGLTNGFTQGLFSAYLGEIVPAELRGTAFGMFYLITGLSLIAANVLAGWLWHVHGPALTFYLGAIFSLFAVLSLLYWRPQIMTADAMAL